MENIKKCFGHKLNFKISTFKIHNVPHWSVGARLVMLRQRVEVCVACDVAERNKCLN